MESPILIHVPHSSTNIPSAVRESILLSDKELQLELRKMTDWFTDELAESAGGFAAIHKYEYSRLVVDPERFRIKKLEIMEEKGMGAVYVQTADGGILREPDDNAREDLLRDYYDPHLIGFEELTQKSLDKFNKCLILDLHSFPSSPLPYEYDQNPDRPDICIGMDHFHTPERLVSIVESFFKPRPYKVERNRPFSGSFIPNKFYESDKRVQSIMLELNRCVYMDEKSITKSNSYIEIQKLMLELITALKSYIRGI